MQPEAEAAFKKAASKLLQQTPVEAKDEPFCLLNLAELLISESHFAQEPEAGIQLLERSAAILEKIELRGQGVRPARARLLEFYAQHWSLTNRRRGMEYYEQSYALYRELNDSTSWNGKFQAAIEKAEESRKTSQET
jgi:hypothetical protein